MPLGRNAAIAIGVVVIVIIAGVVVGYEYLYHPAKTSSKVTITVWGSGSPGGETQAFDQALAAFEKAYPNVTVVDSPAVGVASSTYLSAAHAGKAPDVYRDTSDNAGTLYTSGAIINLAPYLNSTYMNSFTKVARADWTLNGAFYGIPVNVNGIGLFYNKKFVSNPPNTTNQLVSLAENITKNDGIWGLAYGLGDEYGYRFFGWIAGYGGELFNATGYPELNSTAAQEALSFVYNWTTVYKFSPSGITSFQTEQSLFEENKSAMIIDGPWDQSLYESYLGNNLGVAPLPIVSQTGLRMAPLLGSIGYVIASESASHMTQAQLWASLKFAEFMTDAQNQLTLFKLAGDFPSLTAVNNEITTNASLLAIDPLAPGWIEQYSYAQIYPNIPQVNFLYDTFHAAVTNLEANASKGVTVQSTVNAWESAVLQDMKQNGISGMAIVQSMISGQLKFQEVAQPVITFTVISQQSDVLRG